MGLTVASRRGLLLAGGGLLAATGVRANAQQNCPDLTTSPPVALTPAEQERHVILLSLAMALLFDGWGVDVGRTERTRAYAYAEPGRRFADYLGHNVGALLVGRDGRIICYALNRNVQVNSTLEHAEARAVRAAIMRANASLPASGAQSWTFGSLLRDDSLYATLEPCVQCSGILNLASVGTIVWAQDDPGQRHIANVIYNLGVQPRPPLPIRATFLPWWDELDAAYLRFRADSSQAARIGLTSFLETVEAYAVYRRAATGFEALTARHAANEAVLRDARSFRERWRGGLAAGLVPE